jgi:hypothetical protein
MSLGTICLRGLRGSKKVTDKIVGKGKAFYCPLQQRNNHGFFAVNVNASVGFFAQLNWSLYIFAHCERHNLKPFIRYSSLNYTCSAGENWFDYFFENTALSPGDREKLGNGTVRISNISHIRELGLSPQYNAEISIRSANKLFNKYVRLKSELRDYVDDFDNRYFRQRRILGLHYRGTDKGSEAQPVSWDFSLQTILNFLNVDRQISALFVSSDEQRFIEFIEQNVKHIEVLYHDDKQRSSDGKAVHAYRRSDDNYFKGKEALVNCLLLSRCDTLIRTASFLSAWSSIFNPHLPVVLLNRPYKKKLYFPDREIVPQSMDVYLPK